MLWPSEISPQLLDRLTAISYDTILELHYGSVNMWSYVVALPFEGIALYVYGVYGSKTTVMAEAFLKQFLLAPRLLLNLSRGVTERARLLLVSTDESFNSLYEVTQRQQVSERVSNLSRAVTF